MAEEYLLLQNIIPYKLSLEIGQKSWTIYEQLAWQDKKVMGDQFITAIDSVAANIAEGYGRFHYLDRIKFYYNSRGSLMESKHWVQALKDRNKIKVDEYVQLMNRLNEIHKQLNIYIKACYPKK